MAKKLLLVVWIVLFHQALYGEDEPNNSRLQANNLPYSGTQTGTLSGTFSYSRGIASILENSMYTMTDSVDGSLTTVHANSCRDALTRIETLADVKIGTDATVVGRVHKVTVKKPKPRLTIVEVAIVDGTGVLEAILLETMFDLPGLEGVEEVVISREVVEGTARPLYIYADRSDRAVESSASGASTRRWWTPPLLVARRPAPRRV